MVDVLRDSVMITSFVTVMMLVIEYINVLTAGKWKNIVSGSKWKQYAVAGMLGASPGCLGAFAVVAMFEHRIVSAGAVVAAMIATAGDESFVMMAMIPGQVIFIFGLLFAIGVSCGFLSDIFFRRIGKEYSPKAHPLHLHEAYCGKCVPTWDQFLKQWKNTGSSRCVMAVSLALVIISVLTGDVGPEVWNWVRFTLLGVMVTAFFIVSTVPEHFLETHLWAHVFKQHVPSIFLWTFGALLLLMFITGYLDAELVLRNNMWIILGIAVLTGLIPQSGPHLVFLTLYAKGVIPFSVFIAVSIVQDGHGMLPLLASSRKNFMLIKGINFLVGIVVGAILLFAGY